MKNQYYNINKLLQSSYYGMIVTERKPRMKIEPNEIKITLTRKEATDLISILEYAMKSYDYSIHIPEVHLVLITPEQYELAGNIIDGIKGVK